MFWPLLLFFSSSSSSCHGPEQNARACRPQNPSHTAEWRRPRTAVSARWGKFSFHRGPYGARPVPKAGLQCGFLPSPMDSELTERGDRTRKSFRLQKARSSHLSKVHASVDKSNYLVCQGHLGQISRSRLLSLIPRPLLLFTLAPCTAT